MRIAIYLFTLLVLASCAEKSDVKVLKLAHGLELAHPVHAGMVYMAERLEEKSGGTMTIKIYPSGQLGSERELLELLQIGSLAMTKVSSGVLENFVPDFKLLGLPYLFEDKTHLFNVLEGPVGEDLLAKGEDFWFRGLCYYDAGYRSFYTKNRPIHQPSDLAGLKIRVMNSSTAVSMMTQLGGTPTPVSWGELYTALQQGVVDGAENNPPSFYSSRHYEVCKYYSIDEHTSLPDVLLVSLEWWKNLTPTEQQWLKEAAMESVPYQKSVWDAAEKASLKAVEEAGVEIIYPDKKLFSDKIAPMYATFMDDPHNKELINKIRSHATKE